MGWYTDTTQTKDRTVIIVNVTGEPFKRYVVAREDEYMFDGFENGTNRFIFGANALRGRGIIDEQYRVLDTECITKVTLK